MHRRLLSTLDRVEDVSVVTGGRRRIIGTEGWEAGGDTTFLELRTQEPGTYVVSVSTLPRELDLTATEFNEYLEHDGIVDALRERTEAGELGTDVRERYSKHVKAVYQVGENRTAGLDRVLGYPAELIPVTNPYEVRVGGTVAVRALVDAMPVAGQLVYMGGEGSGGLFVERSARTNEAGLVSFRIDEPGRWYIRFIHMEKSQEQGLDYESKWATLTFEVR
jgi:hypothetical protein